MNRLITLLLCLVATLTTRAGDMGNARQIFDKTYDSFYGQGGVRFNYKISALGIYHETGWACYKGNKSKSAHDDTVMWNDGELLYKVRLKKKLVEIHDPKVNKEDQLLQKFKFYPDEFNYSVKREGDKLLLTLKAKKGAKNTKMKEVRILVDPVTYHPQQLRVKVLSLFWLKVTFTNFHAGNIADTTFDFPKEKYSGYRTEDRR
jgi:hypothetical protein